VSFWYQKLTPPASSHLPLPPLPSREKRIEGIAKQPWE